MAVAVALAVAVAVVACAESLFWPLLAQCSPGETTYDKKQNELDKLVFFFSFLVRNCRDAVGRCITRKDRCR